MTEGRKLKQYLGRIVSVPEGDGYAFIGARTVTFEDGSQHDLGENLADVFLHQDDCDQRLRVGLTVTFDAVPNRKKGAGNYRAIGAVEHIVEVEVLPDDDPVILHLSTLPVPPSAARESALAHPIPPNLWAARMKPVDAATVQKVADSAPLTDRPRDEQGVANPDDPRVVEGLKMFLAYEFPQMGGLELGYEVVGVDDAEFDRKATEAVKSARALGMEAQAIHVEEEVKRFRGTRKVLDYMRRQRLLRPNTFLPMRYLPDLFAACPVWFHALSQNEEREWLQNTTGQDVSTTFVHPRTQFFCDLFPGNVRWAHVYQMYNGRVRPLTRYKGDIIPLPIVRLIAEAKTLFDSVVIATPYHDLAGTDWDEIRWVRSVDPYVLGFQNGCSHFFVLGRFSDSGIFPLHAELVADTIAFLRQNIRKLEGFNRIENPRWHLFGKVMRKDGTLEDPGANPWSSNLVNGFTLGNHLIACTKELLRAFDAGKLFDWLRGEWSEE